MPIDPTSRFDAVRQALQELGPDASTEPVSGFIAHRFGLVVPPEAAPLIRATLEDCQRLDADRAARDTGPH